MPASRVAQASLRTGTLRWILCVDHRRQISLAGSEPLFNAAPDCFFKRLPRKGKSSLLGDLDNLRSGKLATLLDRFEHAGTQLRIFLSFRKEFQGVGLLGHVALFFASGLEKKDRCAVHCALDQQITTRVGGMTGHSMRP
jgi:hypothetical protein